MKLYTKVYFFPGHSVDTEFPQCIWAQA